MLKNYLLTAYKVFMRRKLFTAINLLCIVLTLVVLMVITALMQNAFYPSGVEGKSARFLQVVALRMESADGGNTSTSPVGYKLIDKYLKPMQSVERVAAVTNAFPVSVYQEGRVTELQMRRADADYWKVLDFTLVAGRLLTEDDDANGRFVAVINQSSAAKLFGAASALGNTITPGAQQSQAGAGLRDGLAARGYNWQPQPALGDIQAIQIVGDTPVAVSDPRGRGWAQLVK